jgi:hypothetical protein
MADKEQISLLERDLRELLNDRGWEIVEEKRQSVNLDLSVRVNNTPGVVSIRDAFLPSRGLMKHIHQPTYLRVILGRPDGEPSRWAVWDRYHFPRGKYSPDYAALVFHEAIGDDWVALAGCSVSPPPQTWYVRGEVIKQLLVRAEMLAPGQHEDARREQIFKVQRDNFGKQWKRSKLIVTAGVLGGIVLILAGLLVAGQLKGPAPDMTARDLLGLRILISMVLGLPILICSIVGLTYLRRWLRLPRQPPEGMDAVVQSLSGTRAFSEVTKPEHKFRDGLPLVIRKEGRLDEARAPLSVSRFLATSTSHALKLEADLCQVRWPEGASPGACLVPGRWLTVELSGSGSDLAKLPRGPREERRDDVVRWTFTGEEIDSGAVEAHFLTVANAMSSDAGLYR